MNYVLTRFLPSFIRARLEGRTTLQKILANTGWLFIDKIIRMGVGLLVGVWVARYLGPEQFGLYSYALSFTALFGTFATLGLDGIVVRNIVRDPSFKDEILGTAFVLKLLGGALTLVFAVLTVSLLRPHENLIRWLVGIIAAGTIFQAFDVIDFWFQSQVQSRYTVYAKNIAFLLIAIVKIVLILMKAPLVAFAWAGLAEIVVGAMGLIIAYRINRHYIKVGRGSVSCAKGLLKDSWPLILSGIVSMIYLRIDQVMLGEMVGNEEVGIYSAAVRLAEAWYFIPMAIFSSVFPGVVESWSISETLFYERLQKLYNLMALMAYVIAVPVTFTAGWVIKILFGVAYSGAGLMLAVLIWAGLFVNLGVARSSFLTTMNWTGVHFITVFLGCLINVILNYLLIPPYGGMGAVIASCIAYWFAAHGACFVYKPLFKTGYMLTKAMVYPKIW